MISIVLTLLDVHLDLAIASRRAQFSPRSFYRSIPVFFAKLASRKSVCLIAFRPASIESSPSVSNNLEVLQPENRSG